MADENYTFRTIRVVDDSTGTETNIIADQTQDVLTFVSGGDITFQVVEDRIIMSTQNIRGFTGSTGFTGSAGYTGSVGVQGVIGFTGSRGFLGSKGYSGSIGFAGSQGPRGNIGYTGSIGFTGSTGADSFVPGYTGSQGAQGIIGFTGSVGSQGNVGLTGSQGLQGNIGFTGSRGFIGFTGSTGATGLQGDLGPQGNIGYSGSRGNTGYIGSRGYTGSRGIQGIQGNQGVRGYTGSRGLQGIKGNSGYSGSRGFVGSTGFTGSRGVPGPQGQTGTGFTGSRGNTGFTGSMGPDAQAFKTFRTRDSNGVTRNIVADQTQDVLTWVSGAGIYLDFNEGTDTITVINTGGGSGNANVSTDGNFASGNLTLPLTTPASNDIGRVTWDATANVLYIGNGSESVAISGQSAIGYTGSQGATGAQGNVGFTGSAGTTGAQGNVGFTGSQGLIGFTGSTGAGTTQTLSWDQSNTSLSISDGNSVTLTGISGNYSNSNVQAYLDTQGYSNVDLDAQTLSLVGNVITISGSNSNVDLTTALGNVSGSSGSSTFGIAGNLGTHTFDGTTETLTFLGTTGEMNVSVATNFLSFEFADTGVTSGTYGSSSSVPSFTVDEKGRITSVSETTIDLTTFTNSVTFQNDAIFDAGVSEKFSSLTGATGVVTHDCDNGHIFYHSSISANFTANFTNLGLSTNYGTTLTLILDQGATARIPSAVQISGSAQTINWQGGSEPAGTNNGVDAVSFTIFRVSGNYVVLGQLVDFT